MVMTLFTKTRCTCANSALRKAITMTLSLSAVLVGLFTAPALANELVVDIGYQDDIAIDTRYRITDGLFVSSSANKDVHKAGIGYGVLLEDFFLLASYDTEKTGTIYGSYKPRKAHWQVGLRLEQGEDIERGEIEYTYLFNDTVGVITKIDSHGKWFLGLRKWL